MPDHLKMRQTAAAKIEEAERIQSAADAREGQSLTAEEMSKIDGLLAEAEGLQKQAQIIERVHSAKADLDVVDEDIRLRPDVGPSAYAEPKDTELELRGGFGSLGAFAAAVWSAQDPSIGRWDPRLRRWVESGHVAAASGMSQGVGPDGGILVPPTFAQTIWDRLMGVENLISRCDQYTVTGESLTFPAIHETSRVAGSRWGGILGYWIAEADTITSSKPKLRQLKLEPQELAVLCYVTDKLLRNSPVALEQYLTRAATEEINFLVGDAIVNGVGGGQPLGIMKSGSLISVAKETSQLAATVNRENLAKMWNRLHVRSRSTAVWLLHQDVEAQLDLLFQAVKNVAGSENVGGFADVMYNPTNRTIKGRPIVTVEWCQTLGTLGDIILADMQAYAVGVKGGVQSAASMHLKFDSAQTAFRFIWEVDGKPWLDSAITPYKGSNTTSPFVALATRS